MSYLFDGVDDMIAFPATTLGTVLSLAAWINPTGWGENARGHVWCQGTGVEYTTRLSFVIADGQLSATRAFNFNADRATSPGRWNAPADSVVLNEWQWLGVTYDGSVVSNVPTLYRNGAIVAATQIGGAPSGAMVADNLVMQIGNGAGLTRTFAGQIGMVALWLRQLSPEEMLRVYWQGPSVSPRGLKFWQTYAQAQGTQDFSGTGTTPTVTGPLYQTETPPRLSRVAA